MRVVAWRGVPSDVYTCVVCVCVYRRSKPRLPACVYHLQCNKHARAAGPPPPTPPPPPPPPPPHTHTESLSGKGQHCFGAVGSNEAGKWAIQVGGGRRVFSRLPAASSSYRWCISKSLLSPPNTTHYQNNKRATYSPLSPPNTPPNNTPPTKTVLPPRGRQGARTPLLHLRQEHGAGPRHRRGQDRG